MLFAVRVLLTNHRLAARGGSEHYLRDVAAALRRRGHQPIAYSPFHGQAADDLRACAVPVIRDLSVLHPPPDLIHGQHHLPTIEALLRFPGVPAVFFCHGWLPWQEMPPRLSRIVRYVAVDSLRRERLVTEEGIPPELVEVIPNFVDLERFRPRPQPLPQRPRRALVFSNHAVPDEGFNQIAVAACAERDIEVDSLGTHTGRWLDRPEDILANYDIVFARGRAAMEAMAVGCAVILCDTEGLGPMVFRDTVGDLAAANFGMAVLSDEPRFELLRARLSQYDPADAAAVQGWIREHAGLGAAIDRIEKVYTDAISEWSRSAAGIDASLEAAELSSYLHLVQTAVIPQVMREAQSVTERDIGRRVAAARIEIGALTEQLASALDASKASEEVTGELTGRLTALQAELAQVRSSRAVRLQTWMRGHPVLAALYRTVLGLYPPNRKRPR